jgi:DNA-binding response OmpR family regulator
VAPTRRKVAAALVRQTLLVTARPAAYPWHVDEHVLLVEDDASIREVATLGLEQAGLRVTAVGDGREGLARFREGGFGLVLLDVMLPSLDGFEVLREIRRDSGTPIVMLTARSELHDIVVGLELGADDYVTKPFELPELVARIKAVLRRAAPGGDGDSTLSVAGLEIDPGGFSVRKGGEEVNLTATEFRLLHELARRPKQVFTRDLLLELVWNYDYLGDSRLVDAAVQRLRAKVEDDPKQPTLIRTVRGVGYRFDAG